MPFTVLDLILIVGMSQGIFLAISLQLLPNKNKNANKTLALILIIASLSLFARAAPFKIQSDSMLRVGILADATIYIFGPLLYSYIRRLTFNETPKFKLNWIHYIPAFLNIIYFTWSFTHDLSSLSNLFTSGKLNLMFFIIELGGLISISFYWVKAIIILKKFREIQRNQLSFNQNVVRYLIFVLSALGLFLALWLLSFISLYLFQHYSKYINYNTMWLSATLFIYFIGFFSLTQPDIFRLLLENKSTSKKEISRLKTEEIETLKEKLNTLILDKNIYTIPDLSLKLLSEKLETSPNNLSWLLNKVYNKTFYEYINEFRVTEFLKRVEKKQHQSKTILAVAMDAGFNSKSTFNKAFKSIMNDTPSNHIKRIKSQ